MQIVEKEMYEVSRVKVCFASRQVKEHTRPHANEF